MWRGESAITEVEPVERELAEQRLQVQRVAARVLSEALARGQGQWPDSEGIGQLVDL